MINKTTTPPALPISSDSFERLRTSIKGDMVLPSDPTYNEAIVRWSACGQKKAGIVVFPKDEEDISMVLEVVLREKVDLALKGGGHSFSCASSTSGGIVLDLNRYMTKVTVDVENMSVTVQAGAKWKDVDDETIKYGLACVGGTVNDTGVAGLTLGGGHGFLTPRHGLVIDNLLSATIITGTLERLVVSPTSNPELFNALKGGGCNFGVVTSFTYRAHEQKNMIWIGVVRMLFPDKEDVEKQGQLDKLMQGVQKWYEKNGKTNTDASCIVFFGWPLGENNLELMMFYNGDAVDAERCFADIWDLPLISEVKQGIVAPYPAVNGTVAPYGLSCYGTNNVVPALPTGTEAISLCDKLKAIHTSSIYTHTMVLFEVMPTHKLLNAVGKDEMAYTARHDNITVVTLMEWPSKVEADTEESAQEIQGARELSATLVDTGGFGKAATYSNYFTDVEGAERSKTLYGAKYFELQKVKAKYDPNEVFNKWFPIEPAGKAK